MEVRVQNSEVRVQNLESRVRNSEVRVQNSEVGVRNSEVRVLREFDEPLSALSFSSSLSLLQYGSVKPKK
ncbi:hypothetical protein H6G97_10890 [Nostoc flagelliforme FACHB-838]|uniref:Uncharacterized protein n=1 Tax=Nostoc flagelliforme FACHB-838 TaxID=2692904 RepID=A0ABR8DKT0_9NOSO|nr:hypothetical protein [Nostoc flagelliforme]MBD2530047.1 hypothetical protein [Nostoc flagelliforme FACHB-838]